MKIQTIKTERIHSMDSLRAIMMLLGLVIHSALTYGVVDYGDSWSLKDPNSTHISNDFIASWVHAFRMQGFFVVAGFFASMLFYERSPLKMVKNRISRIVIPFAVFVVLLWPTIVLGFGYTRAVFASDQNAWAETLAKFSDLGILIPKGTFHLWFLYYLAMITFASVILALAVKRLPSLTSFTSKVFNWVVKKPILRIVIFAGISAIVYFIMGTYNVSTSTSFVPDFNTFIYYFSFYIIGWVLFKSKDLLDSFTRLDGLSVMLGTALYTFYYFTDLEISYGLRILIKSIVVWLLIFGIMGLFIRYGSKYSARMRYISDSSYWVYLAHLGLTAIIPSLIVDWPLPATLKFLFILTSSGIICFVTYHYFVRSTFIGQFLNGRKYSRKLPEISSPVEDPDEKRMVSSIYSK